MNGNGKEDTESGIEDTKRENKDQGVLEFIIYL